MTLEAIKYSNGKLQILDQLLLPHESKYIDIKNTEDGWKAIHDMQVRGAPAIAVVGALSLAVELHAKQWSSSEELCAYVMDRLKYLVSARPTAVNMADTQRKIEALLVTWTTGGEGEGDSALSTNGIYKCLIGTLEKMQSDDISTNVKMAEFGADSIIARCRPGALTVLTHCNTGSLATAGYGTALGIVRTLHERRVLSRCYCTETRPYNQGARLTAYELVHDQIPATLICDSMVGALLSRRQVSAVLTGADRVAANGDTANKVGTYQIAIIAKYHSIPFYIVAPSTSVDLNTETGDQIVIEERPHKEMTHIAGVPIAADGISCWNPAFDVTPAELITGGIVTEFGVYKPKDLRDAMLKIVGK